MTEYHWLAILILLLVAGCLRVGYFCGFQHGKQDGWRDGWLAGTAESDRQMEMLHRSGVPQMPRRKPQTVYPSYIRRVK